MAEIADSDQTGILRMAQTEQQGITSLPSWNISGFGRDTCPGNLLTQWLIISKFLSYGKLLTNMELRKPNLPFALGYGQSQPFCRCLGPYAFSLRLLLACPLLDQLRLSCLQPHAGPHESAIHVVSADDSMIALQCHARSLMAAFHHRQCNDAGTATGTRPAGA